MSYSFPPELQRLLHEGIAAGDYQSEDEMLLEAVRLLRQRDADLARFKRDLQTRLDRLDRGEGIVLDDDAALRRCLTTLRVAAANATRPDGPPDEPLHA